jgi:hypothetical protein
VNKRELEPRIDMEMLPKLEVSSAASNLVLNLIKYLVEVLVNESIGEQTMLGN